MTSSTALALGLADLRSPAFASPVFVLRPLLKSRRPGYGGMAGMASEANTREQGAKPLSTRHERFCQA
jgi:hypothetical protein